MCVILGACSSSDPFCLVGLALFVERQITMQATNSPDDFPQFGRLLTQLIRGKEGGMERGKERPLRQRRSRFAKRQSKIRHTATNYDLRPRMANWRHFRGGKCDYRITFELPLSSVHVSLSLAATAHFFIAELVCVISACTEGFMSVITACYFSDTKGLNARAAQKRSESRGNGRTIG